MTLSIIVLSYNTKKLTLNCLNFLIKEYKDFIQKKEIEVIVVDNNSSDGTVESLRNFGNLEIVKNNTNYGFSKGNNIGAKKAKGEYILFLNSDTKVENQGLLSMTNFLNQNESVGILGGKLLNPDGTQQRSCGNFYNLFNLIISLLGGERVGLIRKKPEKTQKVDWVSGASLMIRRNLFEKLKGFDENFFMYIEDMELCFRAKSIGFLTYFFPNVKIIHQELGSSNRNFAVVNIYKGILYFYKKHKIWQYPFVKIILLAKALIAILIGVLVNNNYLKKTYTGALKFALPAGRQGI